jgi:flavin-dependent dehydrogenase
MAKICVIGAGPAGSTFAARMAQMGHEVCIVEAARFPRAHLGESLTPGVLPLLDATGVRRDVEAARFPRVRNVHVNWNGGPRVREDPSEQGLLVDRGEFDRLLLQRARLLGVCVRQPARALSYRNVGERWEIDVEAGGAVETLRADFVAQAGGRSAAARPSRRRTGCRTVALYAYWRGAGPPREPRIEAGENSWSWRVPLPDGSCNTLVFVDVNHFRGSRPASLQERFLQLLGNSGLIAGLRNAQLDGAVRVTDATSWLDDDCVTPWGIRIGDAALAIDPISSSGVQKAIQTALSGAIVANTLLRRPSSAGIAMAFYRSGLDEASTRHCRWAAGQYAEVAGTRESRFWQDRAAGQQPETQASPPAPIDEKALSEALVTLSRELEFVEVPALDRDFVTTKPALGHPNLERPVAWLGQHEVAPLLRRIGAPSTVAQLAVSWSDRVPFRSGIAIAAWLIRNGILVEAGRGDA